MVKRVLKGQAAALIVAIAGVLIATSAANAYVVIPPSNVTPPSIDGTPAPGNTLTCTDGTWNGVPSPTFTYQWSKDGLDTGVTVNTLTVAAGDEGKQITCTVSAHNLGGDASATSAPVTVPMPVVPTVPRVTP